jgi:hypothetical protein
MIFRKYIEEILDGQIQGNFGKSLMQRIDSREEFMNTKDECRGIIVDGKLFMTVSAQSAVLHNEIRRWLIKTGEMDSKLANINYNKSVAGFLPVQKFNGKLYVGESIDKTKQNAADIKKHFASIAKLQIPTVTKSI